MWLCFFREEEEKEEEKEKEEEVAERTELK